MKSVGPVLVLAVAVSLGLLAFEDAQVVATPSGGDTASPEGGIRPADQRLANARIRLPMRFEPNRGQADERVKFISRGEGFSLFLTSTEAVLAFHNRPEGRSATEPADGDSEVTLLRLKLLGSNPRPRVVGLDAMPGTTNYFIGNDPGKWRTEIPAYGKVLYQGVYRGIDLVYYVSDQELEYDLVVAPGASPSAIRLQWEGASRVHIDAAGGLVVETPRGELRQPRPRIYQLGSEGERQEIAGRFALADQNRVGFEVGVYDASRTLYIDPVLSYSTYLGGSSFDSGRAIAVDSAGSIYLAGLTVSSDFPVVAPLQPSLATSSFGDAFVAKLSADGSSLVYATYLGGTFGDIANGIAVDAAGNAYVTGLTASANFPTASAFQPTSGGAEDAFVAKLSPAGSSLIFSSFLGGSNTDGASAVALDTTGAAVLAGQTLSPNFPVTPGAFQAECANVFCSDAFVARVTASGTLSFATFLGGTNSDFAEGIALDGANNIYLTGSTNSPNFPVTPGAFQVICDRCDVFYYDVFITKMDPSGSSLVYSTYLGGFRDDYGRGIAVDASGSAYVTGEAESFDFDVTAGAFQPVGGFDAFVTKVDPTGSALAYSTYLGGSVTDEGLGIAVDAAGNAHVTGSTQSADFPIALPTQSLHAGIGADDGFVSIVNPSGSALVFSTFLGGLGADSGKRIVVDAVGNSYVVGETFATNFPTTPMARQLANAGSGDVFITKFGVQPGPNKKALMLRRLQLVYSASLSPVQPSSEASSDPSSLPAGREPGLPTSVVDSYVRAAWAGQARGTAADEGAAGPDSYAPQILTNSQSGYDQGMVLIAGTTLLAGAEGALPDARPVIRGAESVSLYCIGLGPVTNPAASGAVEESGPMSHTLARPTVTIGGVPARVSFSGLAPGWAGLYRVTVLVPADAPAGNAIPVVLTIGGVESNVALIAVQP